MCASLVRNPPFVTLYPLTPSGAHYHVSKLIKPPTPNPPPRPLLRARLYFPRYLCQHLYRATSRTASTSLRSLRIPDSKTSSKHIRLCFRHYSASTLPLLSQTPRPRRGGGGGLGGVDSEDEVVAGEEEEVAGLIRMKGHGHPSWVMQRR